MRTILRGVGAALYIPVVMALLSIPVAIIFNENYAIWSFLLTAGVGGAFSFLLHRVIGVKKKDFDLWEIMCISTLSWILISLVGSIPFLHVVSQLPEDVITEQKLYPFKHFINAYFEAISGYTSTGLTMVVQESKLPHSLQWWRTFMQWIGGVGIIVFISSFHPGLSSVSQKYGGGDSQSQVMPSVSISWQKIWWIYLIFTIFSILLLYIQQVPLWEAINHGLTGIATGGFTITDNSMQHYTPFTQGTVIIVMILGSLNFNLYHKLFTQFDWKKLVTNLEIIVFFMLLLIGIPWLYYENNVWYGLDTAWIDHIFQMVSALGTCGFQTVQLDYWSPTALLLMSVALLIGGTTGSTTGGVKIFRLILMIRSNSRNAFYWLFKHDKEFSLKYQEDHYKQDEALLLFRDLSTFIFIWIGCYCLITFILIHNVSDQYILAEIIFESASAFGSVGLSTGITGDSLSAIAKIDMMAAMIIGRMELIPIIVTIASIYKLKKNA